jgi:hypothetical protein
VWLLLKARPNGSPLGSRLITARSYGSFPATNLKNERMAERRVLRLRALFPRVVSTKVKKFIPQKAISVTEFE